MNGAVTNDHKVTFFYQHFWPDSPPYASMLRSIGRALSENGFEVSLITGKPSYKISDRANSSPSSEIVDGIAVHRLESMWCSERVKAIRMVQKVLFPLRAFLYLLYSAWFKKDKPDAIIAATIPPVINGTFALLAARIIGAKFIYHLQDIYPEIGVLGGSWAEGSFRYRILKWLDVWVCKKAEMCVVLSGDMKQTLVNRGVDDAKISIINNFVLETHVNQATFSKAADIALQDEVNIVFAGNLGRFQCLDVVLEGFVYWCDERAKNGEPIDMEMHFLGDGVVKKQLIEIAAENPNVHFHAHKPFAEASKFIEACQAGIVSLERGVYKYAYPSKTLTYLGLGTPVFAMIENESNLAQEILDNKLGVVCNKSNSQHIADAYTRLYDGVRNGLYSRDRLLDYYQHNQTREVVFEKWVNMLSYTVK